MQADDTLPTRIPPQNKRGGAWITLGDEAYRIPPMAFGDVVELQDDVATLQSMAGRPTAAHMAVVGKIVHTAMIRNYPALTVEEVCAMLDLGNYQEVLDAVLATSGYRKGPASGEVVTA